MAELDHAPGVTLSYEVPSGLAQKLLAGEVEIALLPIIEILRHCEELEIVSDACIGCDGPTMTVRVYSHRPPHEIRTVSGDTHSRTSWALSSVLWRELYGQTLQIEPFAAGGRHVDGVPSAWQTSADAVLLIGDKVVDPHRDDFAYEIDLGGAWRSHTGLPFVFAAWARRKADAAWSREGAVEAADALLRRARDEGAARAAEIAAAEAEEHGWPVALAQRYLCRSLRFTIDARAVEGADLFARLAVRYGLAPEGAELPWPAVAPVLAPEKDVLR